MTRILTALLLVFMPTPAWAQVSPYPDTSITGSAPEMIQKLAAAQSALAQADREIADNQRKFDGLKPIQAALEERDQKLKARSDFLHADWDQKKDAFNAACTTHPMPLNSAEYANCQRRQAQLTQTQRDYEAENARLLSEHKSLKAQYESLTQQGLLHQVQIQKLRNWKSQVEPGMLALKTAIMTQCKGLLQNASPEELKLKCGNVQFDNANPNLPPCTTDACIKARIRDWK